MTNSFSPFGMPKIDPSKMDPKLLMELSQLIQQLPPEKITRMQSLMHNAMAGFDVKKDLEEFERGLPPGFREKLMTLIMNPGFQAAQSEAEPVIDVTPASSEPAPELNLQEARLTLLRAVAEGKMSPEEAEKLLFS